jgi:hypothetical protein
MSYSLLFFTGRNRRREIIEDMAIISMKAVGGMGKTARTSLGRKAGRR